jgi:predicted PolB exonuclease-like 3'-5' exonuclease
LKVSGDPVPHVIVWDLETVPDFSLMAAAQGGDIKRARDSSKLEFPKLPFHKIVCIGALICSREGAEWRTDSIGAPSISDRTERDLVEAFLNRIAEMSPQLVTFNGSSFDFPVLRYRAMAHKLPAIGLQQRNYFNRYTEDAVDLCDTLASFDPRSKVSLDVTCKLFGLSGKGAGITGADVEKYVSAGKIKEVADYCETDVVNTFRVWLRYELFRGALTPNDFEKSERNLADYIRSRANSKSHLLGLLS